jgi:hypothetical protein
LYAEFRNYLRNQNESNEIITITRWVRKFHKNGASHETMLHASSSSPPFFSFDLLKKTLTDLPDHIHWIYLVVRHSLSFGSSGFYLREYLLEIKNFNEELFRKIKIYVTGFILNGKDVLASPHVILASELLHYLERYPIELCTADNFYGLDPIHDFISSMFKEFLTKDFLPGRGRTSSTQPLLVDEDITNETIHSLEAEVQNIIANLPKKKNSMPNPDITSVPLSFPLLSSSYFRKCCPLLR